MTAPTPPGGGAGRGAAVRLHGWSDRLVDQGISALRGVHDGLWLGLATPGLMHAVDEDYYRQHSLYRDPDYNRGGLLPWESAAVERFFAGRRRIVVTAAGGGREVLALLRQGFDVDGYECNAELVETANGVLAEEGFGDRVTRVARDVWPAEAPERCDGVVVGWASYMLTPGRARRVAFLDEARSRLQPGDPVLLSFFSRRRDTGYFRVVAGVANSLRRVRRCEAVEVGDAFRPNFVHCFTEAEIAAELDAAGFKPAWFAEEPYGHAVGLVR